MPGEGPSPSNALRGRRLVGAFAVLILTSALVGIPAEPAAHAAIGGLTNFEIDGNQTVEGPSPPAGGAGIDWANATSFLQDVGQPTEPCGVNPDPTTINEKLNDWDPFAPNPHPSNVNGKTDICQAFTAWEPVEVTAGGVTTTHFVLYGGWRRQADQTGDMSFFIPLIGGPTRANVTLIEFDFNPPAETLVSTLRWNGTAWVATATPPTAFQAAVGPALAPSFGEFAIDLTAAGVLPAETTCVSVVASYVMTRPGNGNADLADYLAVPPVNLANCSPITITKTTTPQITNGPVDFTYTLKRLDGGPVQDSSPLSPPNTDANPSNTQIDGTLSLPNEPTDAFANIFAAGTYQLLEDLPPPAPWSHESIVCNYFDPTVLDANLHATPATATLTNPDGSPTGQTFTVAPQGLLPPGVIDAVTCTISNHAAGLTLAKQVVNTVGNATATPDMWTLSATPSAGPPAIDFGPGTATGVTRPVAPDTYTLAETPNPANPPPNGYAPGPWTCVDAADNPVTVTGGNQVTLAATDDFTCTITNTAQDLARLTLQKVVVGGPATEADFTLSATQGATSGAIDGNPISGVTGDEAITARPVTRGLFTLSETRMPGYLPSWSCTDGTGANVGVNGTVTFPAAFTNVNQLDITCVLTNTFSDTSVAISGSSTNPAGTAHTFTLTATQTIGGTTTPLSGALLDLTFSDPSLVTANTCQAPPAGDGPGTDAAGQCTVTVNSTVPGTFTVTATGFTDTGPDATPPDAALTLATPVTASKTWTTYRVEADSSINVVGNDTHTFTLRGFRNFGQGDVQVQDGTVITYTWSGPGTPSPAGQCTVVGGTCDVTVTNSTGAPASGTLTVTSVIVSLPSGNPPPNDTTTFTIPQGSPALSAPLPAPTKNWIAFRVLVVPSDINLVGQPHTFTVTAQYATEPGVFQPVNGGTVDFNFHPDGLITSSTCPNLSAEGTCTVTANSTNPGTGTLTVTGLNNPGVVINGVPTTFSDPIPNGNSAALDLSAASATKTWAVVSVNITSGADNLAGESHDFTVQVSADIGGGTSGVPDAIVTSTVTSTVGGATVTGNTCETSRTNANGQCTISVTNPGSGSIAIQLLAVTVVIDGKTFVIPLTPGATGLQRDETAASFQTDKVWWQYRVILSDSAINPLGETHTFTATVQRTNDGGTTWVAVPDGALLDATFTDPNNVTSFVPAGTTCLAPPDGDGTGTVGGTCTFEVTSTAATTGTLNVTAIASTWLDRNRNGQNGGPGSLVEDPVEFANEIVTIPVSAFGAGSNVTASKTWWDFTVDVTGPAENPVGTAHTFTATVKFSNGSPAGFQPVATGTTLTFSWAGPAGSAVSTASSTCDPANGIGTDAAGQCTVVVDSPAPGTGTLTITGIDSTTIPEPTRQVSFTFPTPGTTTKTWIAYQASISASATNLVGQEHTFTITVQQDRGDGNGFVPVPDGTKVGVALSDATKLVDETCTAAGTVGGTCTVTVNSTTSGSVTVTPGAITVSLLDGTGATVPVTVQPGTTAYATPGSATKTWVSPEVTVTPGSATNLVGQTHTFTVHVNVLGADGPQPAPDGTTVTWTFDGPGTEDAALTTCGDPGTTGGTCTIAFTNSGTPGSGTLTVTSVTFIVNGQSFNVDLNAAGSTPPTATKTWVAYHVTVTPSATNPVDTQHQFTITATRTDGTTTVPIDGGSIAYTWSDAGTAAPPSPCTTNSAGECTVTVTSATAGTGTLTVTSLTDPGTVLADGSTAVVDLTTAGAPGQAANQTVPLTASKTWLQYRVLLSPAATNLVGEPHTFTATVQQSGVVAPTEADWTAVPDGTTLTAAATGTGTLDPASTCLSPNAGTTAGTCTFVVTSDTPGTLTLNVTAIAGTTIDGNPFSNIALTTPATTTKTWVSAAVTVTPPTATNLVGQTHVFTVHVNIIGADGTTTPQPAPDGTTVTWTFTPATGLGTLDAAMTTCNDPGTTGGTCTIAFTNSGTPGTGTLTVDRVTFTAGGTSHTVDLTAGGTVTPPTATKTWIAYQETVTPNAINPVGTTHTFTITATRTDGTTTEPAAGVQVAFTWTGAGTLLTTSPCTTDAAGQCTVTVSSTTAGSGTLTVTSLTDSAGNVVDLTTPGAPGQAVNQVVPLTTSKTWLQYRVLLPPAATNAVGEPHTFTATVQQTDVADPVETDWVAVPDGTTLTAAATGTGTLDPASTCLSPNAGTTAGTCAFVVTSNDPGTLTLTVTAIAGTTVDGIDFSNIALTMPATTTKTWVSAEVTVTPNTATNLDRQPHTFMVHINVVGTNGSVPAPDGATATWTFDGPGTLNAGATTCNTSGTVDGTCNIVFNNDGTPGSGTLTVTSVTFTLNGQSFTDNDLTAGGTVPPPTATKTWVAYHVTVTPSATNPVGTDHTFTITATRTTDGTTFDPAVGADIAFTWTGDGSPSTASPCMTNDAGQCIVTVTSATAGTGTLTVTSLTDSDENVVDLTTANAPGQLPGQEVPLTASKTWLQYRVILPDPHTNLVGETHTFVATVQQTGVAEPTEADWGPVPDGTTVTATATSNPTGAATLSPTASTCLEPNAGTTAGTCTLVVSSNVVSILNLTVTSIAGTTVGGVDFSNIDLTQPSTTSKTWVSVGVTVTPGTATNVVNQPHTFTVHVNVTGPDGTAPAANGATVVWGFTPMALNTVDTSATTCDNPGTTGGSCNIVFTNSAAGTGTLTIKSVTVTVNGQSLTDDFTAHAATTPPPAANKTWNNYRIKVSPLTATNIVGQPHTFTVLLEGNSGAGFAPLPNAHIALSSSGTAVVNPPIPSACTTDSSGECHITTTASAPGSLELTASYEAASDSGPVMFTASGDKQWDPAAETVTPPPAPPAPPAPSAPGLLPRTGAGMALFALGVAALLFGTALAAVRRRRRRRARQSI